MTIGQETISRRPASISLVTEILTHKTADVKQTQIVIDQNYSSTKSKTLVLTGYTRKPIDVHIT